MSLNGLDDAKVKEAHEAAVAEPGGWFLLKYASRDEIELQGRGNGGIVEIRNAIAQYEDISPLFGFLRYRRRNVVIKYVPEDCSRLVQARATVHFNAVTERFSPHDTVFPISSSKELRDTSLSAACSLHTASGSTSSSTSSLRRRRLMEIAEDEEEDNRARRQSTVPEERPPTAKTASISGQSAPTTSPPPARPAGMIPTTSYRSMASEVESRATTSYDSHGPEPRSRSPTRTIDEPRKSSQSTRPDLYSYSSYGSNGKPKIKLGPRPSLDVGGRPHTSGATSQYRPVSTLPAGVKLFSKSATKNTTKTAKERPKSQYPPETPSMMISPPAMPNDSHTHPSTPTRPHTSGGRPHTSSGASIKPLMSSNTNTPKLPTITPEKARLMKAMEMRKKQKQKSMVPPPEAVAAVLEEETLIENDSLKSPAVEVNRQSGAPKEVHDTLAMLNDMAKEDDSGIAFDASSTLKTDESDATRSDSYPVSPVGPSEQAESTRASSVSGSTDETIQEAQTTKSTTVPEGDKPVVEETITLPPSTPENVQAPAESSTPIEEPAIEEPALLLPIAYDPNARSKSASEAAVDGDRDVDVISSTEPIVTSAQVVLDSKDAATSQTSEVPPSEEHLEELHIVEPQHVEIQVTQQPPVIEVIPEPSSPVKAPLKEWRVPRSKFSVQDLNALAKEPSIPQEPLPTSETQNSIPAALPSPVGSSFSVDTKRSTEDEHENGLSPKRLRRRALVEPIRTDIDHTDRSAANSDAHFSSDDDLMDELQSAVIQNAQPISVSKSPISPVFPSPKKERNRFSRAFSTPARNDSADAHLSPPTKNEPTRSTSASFAYLTRINQQSAKPIAKKVNLGSGISQRIKALERLSSAGPIEPGTTAPTPSPAFFSVRKGSTRESKSPSIAERASSLTRNTPSPTASPESSPESHKLRMRSGSIQSRVDALRTSPIPSSQPQRSRPESISVTARIIRDPNQPYPSKSDVGKDPSEYTPLDLKQSPLVIDHQKGSSTPPKETILERRLSSSSKTTITARERRSSITVVKDLINQGRASFSERRRSITIEPPPTSPFVLSPSRPPSTHTNKSPGVHRASSISSRRSTSSRDIGGSLSPPPTAGSSSTSSDDKDKKSNRASRMLRRMSSSISSSRKNISHAISPTVREETESPSTDLTSTHMKTSVNIGDVNVQFPDSLLWKRRSMILDTQNYLIVSPALTGHSSDRDKANAGAIRRYHLSTFRTPAIPDVEMQELPNSVVLDFIEGGGLQVACEDRGGQARVLNILQEAHRACAAYGQ